jgi:hypothetical protein
MFVQHQQPNQQQKKKTTINSRHPPSIPTLPSPADIHDNGVYAASTTAMTTLTTTTRRGCRCSYR